MQKLQNNWPVICAALNEKLATFDGRPGDLERISGIDYYAARRFLSKGVHNQNKNTRKLCEYFKIDLEESAKVQPDPLGMLTVLLQDVWDGSVPHAELLAKLIKSTKPFKVVERNKESN